MADTKTKNTDYKYILAYALFFIILIFISKSKAGYTAIYYGLVLCVMYVLVLDYKWIATTLEPISGPLTSSSDAGSQLSSGVGLSLDGSLS